MEKRINGKKYLIEPKADLWGANLWGADLWEANLPEANLQGADLRGANLRWANLREANLQGADLRGADLRGVNLRGADLQEANLRGVNLRWADLQEANLRGAKNIPAYVAGAPPVSRETRTFRIEVERKVLEGLETEVEARSREEALAMDPVQFADQFNADPYYVLEWEYEIVAVEEED